VFDKISGSAAPITREAAYPSERNARNIRGTNPDTHIYRTAADTSSRKPLGRSDWRHHFQLVVGLLVMSAIALGGLEVFIRLCANTAMIR
jgi:hypothetical protein